MLNKIFIHGRLTRDPELRTTQSGTQVASFTVAVDRDYADQSGSRDTDFIDCVAWRQCAEFVSKYFRKGQLIIVEGRLSSRKWEDRDGNKRTSWEIICDHTYFGEPKREDRSDSYGGYQAAPSSTGNGYNPPPSSYSNAQPPAPQGQQQTFTDLPDNDGELPFD